MSSGAAPISPARFAEALEGLPASSLALKVLELRNSIAHLDYSNEELKPFAEGRAAAIDSTAANEPDQDCIDAIKENEGVIASMQERIALIKTEVEGRGLSWAEFEGKVDEREPGEEASAAATTAGAATTSAAAGLTNGTNGHAPATNGEQHPAWQDGTFQTGTVRGLGDDELLRRLQERIPDLQVDDDEEEEGMHL
jgi:hypothetical protein